MFAFYDLKLCCPIGFMFGERVQSLVDFLLIERYQSGQVSRGKDLSDYKED
jgi:hypothetical protein